MFITSLKLFWLLIKSKTVRIETRFYVVKRRQRVGGGQKSPILRRHSLWTAPKYAYCLVTTKIWTGTVSTQHLMVRFTEPFLEKFTIFVLTTQYFQSVKSLLICVRGRSQTTWTKFWPILTTYLPIVDFRGHLVHHLPLVHVDI